MGDVVQIEEQRAAVGLTEAAKLTGKNPSTITRARRKGRLSARTDESGTALFDIAELERVFGPLTRPDDARTSANAVQSATAHEAQQRVHDAQKQALQQQIDLLRDQLDDVRRDRDHWRQQATALLTDQRREVAERPGWWRRWWGS